MGTAIILPFAACKIWKLPNPHFLAVKGRFSGRGKLINANSQLIHMIMNNKAILFLVFAFLTSFSYADQSMQISYGIYDGSGNLVGNSSSNRLVANQSYTLRVSATNIGTAPITNGTMYIYIPNSVSGWGTLNPQINESPATIPLVLLEGQTIEFTQTLVVSPDAAPQVAGSSYTDGCNAYEAGYEKNIITIDAQNDATVQFGVAMICPWASNSDPPTLPPAQDVAMNDLAFTKEVFSYGDSSRIRYGIRNNGPWQLKVTTLKPVCGIQGFGPDTKRTNRLVNLSTNTCTSSRDPANVSLSNPRSNKLSCSFAPLPNLSIDPEGYAYFDVTLQFPDNGGFYKCLNQPLHEDRKCSDPGTCYKYIKQETLGTGYEYGVINGYDAIIADLSPSNYILSGQPSYDINVSIMNRGTMNYDVANRLELNVTIYSATNTITKSLFIDDLPADNVENLKYDTGGILKEYTVKFPLVGEGAYSYIDIASANKIEVKVSRQGSTYNFDKKSVNIDGVRLIGVLVGGIYDSNISDTLSGGQTKTYEIRISNPLNSGETFLLSKTSSPLPGNVLQAPSVTMTDSSGNQISSIIVPANSFVTTTITVTEPAGMLAVDDSALIVYEFRNSSGAYPNIWDIVRLDITFTNPAGAQPEPEDDLPGDVWQAAISTGKSFYTAGEAITITGAVAKKIAGPSLSNFSLRIIESASGAAIATILGPLQLNDSIQVNETFTGSLETGKNYSVVAYAEPPADEEFTENNRSTKVISIIQKQKSVSIIEMPQIFVILMGLGIIAISYFRRTGRAKKTG